MIDRQKIAEARNLLMDVIGKSNELQKAVNEAADYLTLNINFNTAKLRKTQNLENKHAGNQALFFMSLLSDIDKALEESEERGE